LLLVTFNTRREVCDVLDFSLLFWTKYENRKTHNMIFLMLDPRFKNLHTLSSFVRREQRVSLVEEYDMVFISYVGQMSWTLASFHKVK
jgi:hypothetical protein